MTGTMEKEIAIALGGDIFSCHVVYLPTGGGLKLSYPIYYELAGFLTSIPHGFKYCLNVVGNGLSAKTRPGHIVIDSLGLISFCPKVNEYNIVLLNFAVSFGCWLV